MHITKVMLDDLPDGAANLRLVLREVNVLEDHVLAVAHIVIIVLVAEITPVALTIVKSRATVLSVVLKFLVDHIFF